MAAGAALAAKRGRRSKSSLKGAFERNVQVDDQETAARVRENQTQKIAEKKAALRNRPELNGWTRGTQELCSFFLQDLHHLFQRLRAHLACSGKRMIKDVYQK